jgi:hypothetical protein
MELKLHGRNFTCSLYTVPTFSHRGAVALWRGNHAGWRFGWVLRVLWFGFVARWSKIRRGDWDDYALAEEQH